MPVDRLVSRSLDADLERSDWVELARALPDGPVRRAVLRSLRRSRRVPLVRRGWSRSPDQFTRHRVNTAIALLFDGRPYP